MTTPAPANRRVDTDWFESAFDTLYPIVYAHRTVEAATRESAFAIAQLKLCDTCSVLDLCCGNGRHMVHLLEHTPRVFGLDYSATLLGYARKTLGSRGRLLRADMRAIPFDGAFDAVANFFTSFGYFTSDAENLSAAREIARVLKPEGRFFIDYLSPTHVAENLEPESIRESAGYEIVERRWLDAGHRRINKATVVRRGGRVVSQTEESVRLYGRDELLALLDEAGLAVEALYGDYDGRAAADDTPRQIVVGTRR